MTKSLNKELDRRQTAERIHDRTKHQAVDGKNWLRHTKKAAGLDEALLDGASVAQLLNIRGEYVNHIRHLESEHGLPVTKGPLRIFDRTLLNISDINNQPKLQLGIQSPGYIPNREDFETAYRMVTRLDQPVPLDAVLDQIEINANITGLELRANWRSITEGNILGWTTSLKGEKKWQK